MRAGWRTSMPIHSCSIATCARSRRSVTSICPRLQRGRRRAPGLRRPHDHTVEPELREHGRRGVRRPHPRRLAPDVPLRLERPARPCGRTGRGRCTRWRATSDGALVVIQTRADLGRAPPAAGPRATPVVGGLLAIEGAHAAAVDDAKGMQTLDRRRLSDDRARPFLRQRLWGIGAWPRERRPDAGSGAARSPSSKRPASPSTWPISRRRGSTSCSRSRHGRSWSPTAASRAPATTFARSPMIMSAAIAATGGVIGVGYFDGVRLWQHPRKGGRGGSLRRRSGRRRTRRPRLRLRRCDRSRLRHERAPPRDPGPARRRAVGSESIRRVLGENVARVLAAQPPLNPRTRNGGSMRWLAALTFSLSRWPARRVESGAARPDRLRPRVSAGDGDPGRSRATGIA